MYSTAQAGSRVNLRIMAMKKYSIFPQSFLERASKQTTACVIHGIYSNFCWGWGLAPQQRILSEFAKPCLPGGNRLLVFYYDVIKQF